MSITKRNDKASRDYWAVAKEAKKEVDKWPEWKREFRVMEIFRSKDHCLLIDAAKKHKKI